MLHVLEHRAERFQQLTSVFFHVCYELRCVVHQGHRNMGISLTQGQALDEPSVPLVQHSGLLKSRRCPEEESMESNPYDVGGGV